MKDGEKLGFEEALARLESVVAALDGGELTLEDSLRDFEEGVRLVRQCSEQLQAAEARIRVLEEGPEGTSERDVALVGDE